MSGGLNDNNREEWQIVKPDDENGIIGWRVTLIEETDGLLLKAYDEEDRVWESLVLEPYLLDAYLLTFKQAAYHAERSLELTLDELKDCDWERILNPFDELIEVEYYMILVQEGLYELGTRLDGEMQSRVQIGDIWLTDFIDVFEDVQGYYQNWVLGESEPRRRRAPSCR